MNRRSLLAFTAGILAAPAFAVAAQAADAQAAGSQPANVQAGSGQPNTGPYGIRALGHASAPIQATEFYSLTCPHCAEFENATLPAVIDKFIKPGKLRIIFSDFPLDGVALMATQVARSLPVSEYYPFVSALFASQEKWAFAPGEHTLKQYHRALFRYAALAGMSKADFDAALANDKLKQFILDERANAERKYHVDATPTFIMDGKKHAGAMDIKAFSRYIGQP